MVEKVHPREWSMEDRRLSSRCSASRCSAATLSHKAAGIDVATVPPLWLNDPVRSRTVPSATLDPPKHVRAVSSVTVRVGATAL